VGSEVKYSNNVLIHPYSSSIIKKISIIGKGERRSSEKNGWEGSSGKDNRKIQK
jgi:hypothetical protein